MKTTQFGSFEALMAGLAFAGLLYTILMQQYEIGLQRNQTDQQTLIFHQESFESRFFQALDQFRSFQSETSFQADLPTLFLSQDQSTKLRRGENVGLEPMNALVKAHLNWALEENKEARFEKLWKMFSEFERNIHKSSDQNTAHNGELELETGLKKAREMLEEHLTLKTSDFSKAKPDEYLAHIITYYGGVLYPFVRRSLSIMRLANEWGERAVELGADRYEGMFDLSGNRELRARYSERYIEFYRMELKPAQHALIALCALYDIPYSESNAPGAGMRSSAVKSRVLNDFPRAWRETFVKKLKIDEVEILEGELKLRDLTERSEPSTSASNSRTA
ncbi:hypothetical protein [Sulfitobacter sp.]|jgi:hypothetical protein|uniref:hypothetical protein n=1 Tax=Sulfitobacter sp. TaxID=1903071 RepID=UPI0039E6E043